MRVAGSKLYKTGPSYACESGEQYHQRGTTLPTPLRDCQWEQDLPRGVPDQAGPDIKWELPRDWTPPVVQKPIPLMPIGTVLWSNDQPRCIINDPWTSGIIGREIGGPVICGTGRRSRYGALEEENGHWCETAEPIPHYPQRSTGGFGLVCGRCIDSCRVATQGSVTGSIQTFLRMRQFQRN